MLYRGYVQIVLPAIARLFNIEMLESDLQRTHIVEQLLYCVMAISVVLVIASAVIWTRDRRNLGGVRFIANVLMIIIYIVIGYHIYISTVILVTIAIISVGQILIGAGRLIAAICDLFHLNAKSAVIIERVGFEFNVQKFGV